MRCRRHNIGEVNQAGSPRFNNDTLVGAGMAARDGCANLGGQRRVPVDEDPVCQRLQALRGVPVGRGDTFVGWLGGQLPLRPLQNNLGVGKNRRERAVVGFIDDAAHMIEVEMAQHDVGHVFACVAQGAQLASQTAAAPGRKKLFARADSADSRCRCQRV